MAVNEQGYVRPTYDDLLAARIEQAQELFGDDIDTSNNSPLGKFIRLAVQDLADAYEEQEIIYYARFPHTATGQNLDRLMPFAAITRNPATRAEHEITFKGVAGYEVPVEFLVGTTEDEKFYLVNAVTLDENGSGVGVVQCTELGVVGNVSLGAITEIVNPDANVEAISHTNILVFAEDEETDEHLRTRFDTAIEGSGSGTASAIRGEVMRVTGVSSCLVIENESGETDADGRPPHSFEVFVHAPTSANQDIAEAIYRKKPLGIHSYGEESVSIVDTTGNAKLIYFSHVAEVAVYVEVTVAVNENFPLDGSDQIKTALLEYISELNAGEDVVCTTMYKYIYGVDGVKDANVKLSADGATYSTENIVVGSGEVAALTAENIAIEVTDYADK